MLSPLLLLSGCLYLGDDDIAARRDDWDQDGYLSADAGGPDCDDQDPDVHPRVREICGDGKDNDCDGSPGSCRLTGTLLLSDGVATWYGGADGDHLGEAVALAGDVDGDGQGDVLIGAPRDDGAATDAGAAFLYRGPWDGTTNPPPAATLRGEAPTDELGAGVLGPGDVDGDGFDDVLTGVLRPESVPLPGAVALWYGPVAGEHGLSDADVILDGEDGEGYLGFTQSTAGDVNGDGMADLALGACSSSVGAALGGGVYVVASPLPARASLSEAWARLTGPAGAQAGIGVSGGGDSDGDGVPDLWIGGYGVARSNGEPGVGGAWLVPGDVTGTADLPSASTAFVLGEDAHDAFGFHTALVDLDADGYADLVAGAPHHDGNAGAVYLFRGPLTGDHAATDAETRWDGPWSGLELGQTVHDGGDFDGDGHPDLVISGVGDMDVQTGTTWVLYGPVTEATLADALRLDGTQAGEGAGWAMDAGRDIEGDGTSDVVVGAYGNDVVALDAGAAWLVRGQGM